MARIAKARDHRLAMDRATLDGAAACAGLRWIIRLRVTKKRSRKKGSRKKGSRKKDQDKTVRTERPGKRSQETGAGRKVKSADKRFAGNGTIFLAAGVAM